MNISSAIQPLFFMPGAEEGHGMWRSDAYSISSRIHQSFSDMLDRLTGMDPNDPAAKAAALEAAALVRMHLWLSDRAGQRVGSRRSDARSILAHLKQYDERIAIDLENPSKDEVNALRRVIKRLKSDFPPEDDERGLPFGPVVGAIARPMRQKGYQRKAGTMGVDSTELLDEPEFLLTERRLSLARMAQPSL